MAQNETQQRTDVLDEAEALAITALRMRLVKMAERTLNDGWELSGGQAVAYGRLVEALEGAEERLFDVLNTAASRLDSKQAGIAIDAYYDARTADADRAAK